MISYMRMARSFLRSRSGATAVEFAIVCLPLLLLSLGIVEFGRAFLVRNDLAYAADVAARKVLIGQIPFSASAEEVNVQLETAVRGAFSGQQGPLHVDAVTQTIDGMQFRVLSVRYTFTFLLPALGDSPVSLDVSRRIPVS